MGFDERIVAVIQARVGSSRLPSKVLRALGVRPVLEWVVRAAQAAKLVDEVVIATSVAPGDDAIEALGRSLAVSVIRGSEDDVLSRFLLAADAADASAIVRLTADCPLLDPTLIDQVVNLWRSDRRLDYVSTTLARSLPRGLDVELATVTALQRASQLPTGHHRVHVTSAFYQPDSGFELGGIVYRPDSSRFRVTLDTAADAEVLDAIVAVLGDRLIPWREVTAFLESNPDVVSLNSFVVQKALDEG